MKLKQTASKTIEKSRKASPSTLKRKAPQPVYGKNTQMALVGRRVYGGNV